MTHQVHLPIEVACNHSVKDRKDLLEEHHKAIHLQPESERVGRTVATKAMSARKRPRKRRRNSSLKRRKKSSTNRRSRGKRRKRSKSRSKRRRKSKRTKKKAKKTKGESGKKVEWPTESGPTAEEVRYLSDRIVDTKAFLTTSETLAATFPEQPVEGERA